MLNNTSLQRLSQVHPYLAYLVKQLDAHLESRSIHIQVAQGLRTWNEQEQLYAKGRTAPGPKVTDCQPGHSYHNFGLAVDIFPEDLYGQPDWNASHPAWQIIHEVALSLGFTCGADFRTSPPDQPHLQITGKFPAAVPDDVRQEFMEGGIPQVWTAAGLPTTPQPAYSADAGEEITDIT